jgi:trans-2,3-dihydro-3-hydroxyanthranilate isomerase
MKYKYYICDVFTDRRFGGNQLAVLTDAEGLGTRQMQQIAREFNFSESTFVFPPEQGNTRRVRIFTPATEVPFAGHPNVGTAFVLASLDAVEMEEKQTGVVFEEKAGLVPVTIQKPDDGPVWCELRAPETISLGQALPVDLVAASVSLSSADIVGRTHPPRVASVGLPFIMVELRDRSVLERARANMTEMEKIEALGVTPDIHLYVHSDDEFDIRARMFAPFDGVPEDPATGSANCALAGLLAHHEQAGTGMFAWRIAQGVEMGRPSLLETRAEKSDGGVTDTWVGGTCVMVSEGVIYID